MPTTETSVAMRDSPICRDRATNEDIPVLATRMDDTVASRWEAIIDNRLIEWGQSPRDFEVEGLIGPSSSALLKALRLVTYMRDRVWPLPTNVIADGEGGIVFENRRDRTYQRIEIDKDGVMNLITFKDGQMQGHPVRVEVE